ncbi:hypothetical protein [Rhizobium sp. CCGE 510]|uniref:hypothetical protein n=1 Tax=Rhizobium sp. CCGE 510 TaxID=1132836 RepID=UPI0012F6AD11|nr:hypothetical protein [Rhizobium sp. CCGE 510]
MNGYRIEQYRVSAVGDVFVVGSEADFEAVGIEDAPACVDEALARGGLRSRIDDIDSLLMPPSAVDF